MKKTFALFAVTLAIASCNRPQSLLDNKAFQADIDGKTVALYTLRGGDLTMQVTNFGGRVITLFTPDRNGKLADVEVGYGTLDEYVHNKGERYLGAIVGPVANRIAAGTFVLDGETYFLPKNNNGQTLHGGTQGLDMVVWDVAGKTDSTITLHYLRPDGQDGFPGNLDITVTYTLTSNSGFCVDYVATTDKATPVNLSQHTFFNLKGCGGGTVLDNVLEIRADRTTPIDEYLIPSGEIVSLEGSPLDFRKAHEIGRDIDADNDQIRNGNGYDHNFILDRDNYGSDDAAVIFYEPSSGRKMEVFTDQPAVQFYAGNFFDGKTNDRYGNPIGYREAFALETQKYPDAVHHSNFPDTILRPGEVYNHHCEYRFSAE